MKFIVLFLAVFVLMVYGCSDDATDISADLARCVGSDSTLYISTGCSACAKQKSMFGDNINYISIVDCAESRQECVDADITRVPTWVVEGKNYKGVKTAEELKELTGC